MHIDNCLGHRTIGKESASVPSGRERTKVGRRYPGQVLHQVRHGRLQEDQATRGQEPSKTAPRRQSPSTWTLARASTCSSTTRTRGSGRRSRPSRPCFSRTSYQRNRCRSTKWCLRSLSPESGLDLVVMCAANTQSFVARTIVIVVTSGNATIK
jgi:hypothetical protein